MPFSPSPSASNFPADAPYLSRRPEFLRDCGLKVPTRLESQWTTVNGLRIHSRRSKICSDIPYVLIHGLVISSLYMIPLAECLAVEHEVHALDLPGFGRSQGVHHQSLTILELSDFVAQWMNQRGIVCCHLVANSMGCQVAAHLAVNQPDCVATLTLMGATVDPAARKLFPQILRLSLDALREPPRLWLSWLFDFGRAGLRRTFGTVRAMFIDRIDRELPFISAPTLLMRGQHDPTMPERWMSEAAGLLGQATKCVISGAAHCAHYSDPIAVAREILEHSGPKKCASSKGSITQKFE